MQDSCPKCNTIKTGESCPKCGLVFAKFDQAVFLEGVPDELVALWKEVENDWQEKKLHAVFVERCMVLGEAGYAAARYRSRGGDAIAEAYLETINTRLAQMLNAVSTPPPKRATSRLLAVLILFIVLAGVSLLLYFFPRFPK
jgi:hypothetical protein